MCKRSLLLAFSNHITACHLGRKLVTHKNCKVRTLRNLFSNADLQPFTPEPVRATEAVFVDWTPIRTACFASGRIQDRI